MKSKLILSTLAASVAASALLAAAPASAAIHFVFVPGAPSPSAGYSVIDDFNVGLPGNVTGFSSLVQIKTPPSDGNGATPANSVPAGTPYLSVLGGGVASIDLGGASSFEFDWGSIDTYNSLVIHASGGEDLTVTPGGNFSNDANGNQVLPGTNGLFIVTGDAGEKFTGITLSSSSNSFEIDNVAVAGVPEPASWSLMILGFGMAGGLMRAKRRKLAFA
jgi:PEP-CTERM motif-containing protein